MRPSQSKIRETPAPPDEPFEQPQGTPQIPCSTEIGDELFEQAPEAVAVLSADDRIVRVNKEFTRISGYTAEEVAGHGKGHFARLRSDWNNDRDDGSGVQSADHSKLPTNAASALAHSL